MGAPNAAFWATDRRKQKKKSRNKENDWMLHGIGSYLCPNWKWIGNDKLEKLRKIFPLSVTVIVQCSADQPKDCESKLMSKGSINGGGKMRQHSNFQMHTLTYIKTQWWGTSHDLRVSSKFLDIVFHDEIITPSSTNGFNGWFWCIQKQDPLSLCLNFCLLMDDIA